MLGYKFGAARETERSARIHKTEAHTHRYTHAHAQWQIHLAHIHINKGIMANTHERNETNRWLGPKKSNCHLSEPFDLFSFDLGGNCDSSVSGISCWRFSSFPFLEHPTRPSWETVLLSFLARNLKVDWTWNVSWAQLVSELFLALPAESPLTGPRFSSPIGLLFQQRKTLVRNFLCSFCFAFAPAFYRSAVRRTQ